MVNETTMAVSLCLVVFFLFFKAQGSWLLEAIVSGFLELSVTIY